MNRKSRSIPWMRQSRWFDVRTTSPPGSATPSRGSSSCWAAWRASSNAATRSCSSPTSSPRARTATAPPRRIRRSSWKSPGCSRTTAPSRSSRIRPPGPMRRSAPACWDLTEPLRRLGVPIRQLNAPRKCRLGPGPAQDRDQLRGARRRRDHQSAEVQDPSADGRHLRRQEHVRLRQRQAQGPLALSQGRHGRASSPGCSSASTSISGPP